MPKTIAIIGLGYVGLPLALRFAESGTSVLGLDIDAAKVVRLNAGESYIKHIPAAAVQAAVQAGRLEASADFSRVQEVEAVIICVPTPLNKHREPDISYILKTGRAIAPYLRTEDGEDPKLVVLESTTYPGTTDTDLRKVLEDGSGLKAGEGFHLAFSPEREDPGRTDHSVKTIPKIVGGLTPACQARAVALYGRQPPHSPSPSSSPKLRELPTPKPYLHRNPKTVTNFFQDVTPRHILSLTPGGPVQPRLASIHRACPEPRRIHGLPQVSGHRRRYPLSNSYPQAAVLPRVQQSFAPHIRTTLRGNCVLADEFGD